MTTRITRQEIPIEQRMTDILKQLEIQGGRQSFYDLFVDDEREIMVVTFLAVLELMKNQQIIIEQEHNFDEISYQAILNLHRVSIENGIEIVYLMLGLNVSFGTRENIEPNALIVIRFLMCIFMEKIGGRSS